MSIFQIKVDVKDKQTAQLIEDALKEADMRAFVTVIALLSKLPTKRSQERALHYLADHLDEQSEMAIEEIEK